MITNIGIVAGEIWHYLDEKGKTNLNDLVDAIQKASTSKEETTRELVLMSIGWLAREGHVFLGRAEQGYPIELIAGE